VKIVILGIEIAMIVIVIMALVQGKLKLGKTRVVTGTPARLLELIGFLPIPLTLVVSFVVAAAMVLRGGRVDADSFGWTAVRIEAGCAIGCLVLMYGIGAMIARPPAPAVEPDYPEFDPDNADAGPSSRAGTGITDRPKWPAPDDRIRE
jgi:hypothetical protein